MHGALPRQNNVTTISSGRIVETTKNEWASVALTMDLNARRMNKALPQPSFQLRTYTVCDDNIHAIVFGSINKQYFRAFS